MNNLNLIRGLFLMAIALVVGGTSLSYRIGDFAHAGPGLFPAIVSFLLLLIGIATVVRARFVERVPLDYRIKNIALVLASLCGFVVLSQHLNMIVGILFLVFCSSYAGKTPSWKRSLQISVGLIIVAFMFRNLLGLNLPMY